MNLTEEIYILYLKLRGGYWNCICSLAIWRFMMTNDLNRLYERCHGLNGFDEFYSCLNGWMRR